MKVLDILKESLFLSDKEWKRYVSTCPRRYKRYPIEKRSGGERWIAQPSSDLKVVQKIMLKKFLMENLKVHKNAFAYVKGKSIADNARTHCFGEYFLKMDFKDFFPSIRDVDLIKRLCEFRVISEDDKDDIYVISRIFFMLENGERILSIGAPSSPFISNALLCEFDESVTKFCDANSINYSRYSDDLTFSTNKKDILFKVPRKIADLLKVVSMPSLMINEKKTVFSSKAHNRHVTGITITNEGALSIGRGRKRSIRSQLYLFGRGRLDEKQAEYLRGYISHIRNVDREFYDRLKSKYSTELLRLFRKDGG